VEDYKEDLQDYFGRTVVHPVGLALVVILAVAMVLAPRRWALLPMVLVACLVSQAQRIIVCGLNFDFLRIMILAGWTRLFVRREIGPLRWNAVDTCIVVFATCGVTAYCLLHADSDAVKYRLGWAFDVLGYYFLFRFLLRGDADPRLVARPFVLASVPVAAFFAVEYVTHRNLFSVFGGVPAMTWVRDGRLRCQGPFAHPVIAGVYWASQLPIIGVLWFYGGQWRKWAVVGVTAALFTICATNSSTSVTAVIFGAIGTLAFPIRRRMAAVCWATAGILFALHMVMKAPVWHLLASATVFDASTGWDRFYVIDQSLRHFGDWWLLGTKSTDSWNVWDITNEYVFTGIEGGAFTLAAFLALIWFSFRRVGLARERLERDPVACRMAWALGAALFVHCMNYIGLAYYGQAKFVWYLLLALVASQAVAPLRAAAAAPRPVIDRRTRPAVAVAGAVRR
jgi:hypothetical protein